RVSEILALYSNEIKKYPDEQGLYEQQLQWLGQTNLVEDQLRVYQEAIKRFTTNVWTDRLARWYLRRERKNEFEKLSRDLIDKMNDGEIETWFAKFVTSGARAKGSEFEANLYLNLNRADHKRWPNVLGLVEGQLNYSAGRDRRDDWSRLRAKYFSEPKTTGARCLPYLSSRGKLREYAEAARDKITAAN